MSSSDHSAESPNEKFTILGDKDKANPTGAIDDPSAHILDVNKLGVEGQGLQTASDGKTVLIPQPSSDPNDPLNWSSVKKHGTLFVLAVVAFMANYGSAVGIITLLPQAGCVARWSEALGRLADEA